MQYKIGDTVKLKSAEELIKLGTWTKDCAYLCGGKTYLITDIKDDMYYYRRGCFREDSIAGLSIYEEAYTMSAFKKHLKKFMDYATEFSKVNKCDVAVDFSIEYLPNILKEEEPQVTSKVNKALVLFKEINS